MTLMSETTEHDRCKHQALGFDLPVLISLTEKKHFLSYVHDALWVMSGDAVENVK
jgi:hypothetical protein